MGKRDAGSTNLASDSRPGRGQKKCRECGEITGPRAKACKKCGAAFPTRSLGSVPLKTSLSAIPIDETFCLIDHIRSFRKKLTEEEMLDFAAVVEKTGVAGLRKILDKLTKWE